MSWFCPHLELGSSSTESVLQGERLSLLLGSDTWSDGTNQQHHGHPGLGMGIPASHGSAFPSRVSCTAVSLTLNRSSCTALTFPWSFWTEPLLASGLRVLQVWGRTGMCMKGIAQNSWHRNNSLLVPAQSLMSNLQPMPSSPRPGAEGLEPGQTLPFLPQLRCLSKVRGGPWGNSTWLPVNTSWIVVVDFFNQERFTTLTKCEI